MKFEARQEELGGDIVHQMEAKDVDDASDIVFNLTQGGFFNKNGQITIYDISDPDAPAVEVGACLYCTNKP